MNTKNNVINLELRRKIKQAKINKEPLAWGDLPEEMRKNIMEAKRKKENLN